MNPIYDEIVERLSNAVKEHRPSAELTQHGAHKMGLHLQHSFLEHVIVEASPNMSKLEPLRTHQPIFCLFYTSPSPQD